MYRLSLFWLAPLQKAWLRELPVLSAPAQTTAEGCLCCQSIQRGSRSGWHSAGYSAFYSNLQQHWKSDNQMGGMAQWLVRLNSNPKTLGLIVFQGRVTDSFSVSPSQLLCRFVRAWPPFMCITHTQWAVWVLLFWLSCCRCLAFVCQ